MQAAPPRGERLREDKEVAWPGDPLLQADGRLRGRSPDQIHHTLATHLVTTPPSFCLKIAHFPLDNCIAQGAGYHRSHNLDDEPLRRRASCRAWTCSEQHGSGDPPAARPSRTWTRSCDEQHGLDNPQARIEGGETQDCPVCVKNSELRGAWRVGEGADLRLCEGLGGAAVRRRCKTPDGGFSTSPQLRILNRNSRFPCSRPPLSPQLRILNRAVHAFCRKALAVKNRANPIREHRREPCPPSGA